MVDTEDERTIPVSREWLRQLMKYLHPGERWTSSAEGGVILWTAPNKKLHFIKES